MKENQKAALELKRKHLHLQLHAKEYIYRGIQFHWLEYFNALKKAGLQFEIEYLLTTTKEEEIFYKEAIEKVNNSDLNSNLAKVIPESLHDILLTDFPSISSFKYVMNLPLLNSYETDTSKMLLASQKFLDFKEEEVYFLSSDCSPLLKLRWNELIVHANDIFDDSLISLIFTDLNNKWIIFRSIENEWRCGFWKNEGLIL